jgi:hypothetical protein
VLHIVVYVADIGEKRPHSRNPSERRIWTTDCVENASKPDSDTGYLEMLRVHVFSAACPKKKRISQKLCGIAGIAARRIANATSVWRAAILASLAIFVENSIQKIKTSLTTPIGRIKTRPKENVKGATGCIATTAIKIGRNPIGRTRISRSHNCGMNLTSDFAESVRDEDVLDAICRKVMWNSLM